MNKINTVPEYYEDEHWHLSYMKNNQDIEGIGLKRKTDDTWDVYFGDFSNDLECTLLLEKTKNLKDEILGLLLFNSKEYRAEEDFYRWVEDILIPIRTKIRNDK